MTSAESDEETDGSYEQDIEIGIEDVFDQCGKLPRGLTGTTGREQLILIDIFNFSIYDDQLLEPCINDTDYEH